MVNYKFAFWALIFILGWAYKEEILSTGETLLNYTSGFKTSITTANTASFNGVENNNLLTEGYTEFKERVVEFTTFETSMNESRDAIKKINEIREENGKRRITFDQRAYQLALARAKDMYNNNYFDHTNPITGECPDSMKYKYGFNTNEYAAENAFMMSGGIPSSQDAIDSWMTSRGHRYNLLYDNHISGAFACYNGYCSFLGINKDLFGQGCHTGEEGLSFWNTALKQPGEV